MIHHVFANRSNIGDWLSAQGIQALLPDEPVEEHLCDEPFVTDTLAALAELRSDDHVIIGGGGLFMDYFLPFWEGFASLAEQLAFTVWGVGFCDLKHEPSRAPSGLLRSILDRAGVCVVRDELTRDLLERPSLPVVPCPALNALAAAPPGHGLLHVDNYTTAGETVYEAMDGYGQEFAARTRRSYRQTNNRIEAGSRQALDSVLERYVQSDLVLSSALHGCIIAVAMGRPVLAISGDRKIEGFMSQVGLGDWVLDVSEVDRVPELLTALPTQRADPDILTAAQAGNQQVAADVLALVRKEPRCERS